MPDEPTSLQGFATIPRSILHDSTIHRDAKLVYLMLSSHAGGNRTSWPSHKRIADLLGISVSNVKIRLKWLRAHGYITWTSRATDDGAQLTNNYVILIGTASTSTNTGSHTVTPPSREVTTPRHGVTGGVVTRWRGGSHTVATNKSQLNDTKTTTSAEPPRTDVTELCNRLADRIEGNGSKRPAIGPTWLDATRLMLDKDGRTQEQIAKCIDWCQADEFWRANILSMPTLRAKYEQLRLSAARGATGPKRLDRAAHAASRGIPEGML